MRKTGSKGNAQENGFRGCDGREMERVEKANRRKVEGQSRGERW